MLDHAIEDTFDIRSNLDRHPLQTLDAIARLYRDILKSDPAGPFSDIDRAYLADIEAALARKWGGWEWLAARGV